MTYAADWDARARENDRWYSSVFDGGSEAEFAASGDRDARVILDLAGVAGGAALEIGCGAGRLLAPMALRFRRVVGVDVSREMLQRAGARLESAGLRDLVELTPVEGDGRLGVAGPFDLVYSWTVFQHVRRGHVRACLGEIARMLAPGGAAALHFAEPFGLRRSVQAFLHLDPPPWDTWRLRYWREADVRRACERAGLRVEERRALGRYALYRVHRGGGG